jgi:anti-sigma factor RsiW
VIGHVGTRVSALVDGQLPAAEAERLWAHVHLCPPCRAAVEREGWVKTRVAGLALTGEQPAAPGHLAGSLRVTALGWPEPLAHPDSHDRRRLLAAAIGMGSVGAAFVGVLAMTVPAQAPGVDRRPTTSLTRPSESAGSPTGTTGTRYARSLLQGTTTSARLALTAAPKSK